MFLGLSYGEIIVTVGAMAVLIGESILPPEAPIWVERRTESIIAISDVSKRQCRSQGVAGDCAHGWKSDRPGSSFPVPIQDQPAAICGRERARRGGSCALLRHLLRGRPERMHLKS